MQLSSPCLTCGEPTKPGPRCEECSRRSENLRIKKHAQQKPTAARGYGSRWQRLSRRARELQPFCSDCGALDDLQADHTPEAWRRHEKGLPLRLKDIDVVCGPCNRRRGAARGEGATRRLEASSRRNDTGPHSGEVRPSAGHTDPGEGPLAGQRPDSHGPQLSVRLHSHLMGSESQEVGNEGGS